ncbi:MAG: methionine synthase [Oscillospiraceae bacterium]|jgi:5-methyltetrahydrofolate--homocysteine methyltransferase|nr:methionine synthase [Oscillospiraceae bacterium]
MIERVDIKQAARLLGFHDGVPDEVTLRLIEQYEPILADAATPRYRYIISPVEKCPVPLIGNDIQKHLENCENVALLCATLGAKTDTLIRSAQITSMAGAVVLDALAGAAIEQVCDKCESEIAALYPNMQMTYRFSPGYGDYPLSVQPRFLLALDAVRRTGISVTESGMLTPSKSVTAIIGMSSNKMERTRRGCISCSVREKCTLREKGEHCGF